MGNFVIHIEAVGGHGCQRDKKAGAVVEDCGEPNCPDCNARQLVKKLGAGGNSIVRATLTHWPEGPGTVVDNLKTGVRSNSF